MPTKPQAAPRKKGQIEVRSKIIRPDPSLILGQGGEAVVFDISKDFAPEQLALKIWKPPEHPDYAGDDEKALRNRTGAKIRIETFGRKLLGFPSGLPDHVVKPLDLAKEGKNGRVVGYTMRKLSGAEKLMRLASRGDRQALGAGVEDVVRIFMDLHGVVSGVHKAGVVIGDFNYSNVLTLIGDHSAYVIDADSFQFKTPLEEFLCRTFTPRFVDPLICDPGLNMLVQQREHSTESDWYAFSLMLFECVMNTAIYGGTYTAPKGAQKVTQDARPLHRISVFNPTVIYPGPNKATPLSWLPTRVRGHFEDLVAPGKDARGKFPRDLLEILLAHAQGKHVDPSTVTPPAAKSQVLRGKIRWTKIVDGSGVILDATLDGSILRYLAHVDDEYRRESGASVLSGTLNRTFKVSVLRDTTVFGSNDQIVVLRDGKTPLRFLVSRFQGGHPVFATNATSVVWCHEDGLYTLDGETQSYVGSVLENQTLVWLGSSFGFGFYRMDGYRSGFTFDPTTRGLTESAKLPPMRGELVDATCTFTDDRCWFFAALRFDGVTTNMCTVLNRKGEVLAHAEEPEGSIGLNSWLASIRAKAAVTFGGGSNPLRHALFAATDNGLTIVEERAGTLTVTATFPDAEDLVSPADTLLYSPTKGLYVVNRHGIGLLTMG